MTQTYWPFPKGSAGSQVLEPQWSQMARNWLATGVLQGFLNQLAVTADGTAMQVNIDTGAANIMGNWFKSDAPTVMPIAAADPANPRIDVIAIRVDWVANTVAFVVLQGVPAANPVAPALTQTDILVNPAAAKWDLALATVTVPAGATVIQAANVTDERTFTAGPTSTPTPGATAQYDQNGNLSGNLVTAAGYLTHGTGPASNQWAKIATVTINIQFGNAMAWIDFAGGASGNSVSARGRIFLRVKQQNAMGQSPFIELALHDFTVITPVNVVAVTSVNSASETVVDLYIEMLSTYEQYSYNPSLVTGTVNTFTFYPIGTAPALVGSLPAGTQTVAVSGDTLVDSWHVPTLLNGWVNYGGGFEGASYKKDSNGFVHPRGLIKSGTTTAGTPIIQLPPGYLPSSNLVREAGTYSSGTPTLAELQIQTSGNLNTAAGVSSGWLNLADITPYMAEA